MPFEPVTNFLLAQKKKIRASDWPSFQARFYILMYTTINSYDSNLSVWINRFSTAKAFHRNNYFIFQTTYIFFCQRKSFSSCLWQDVLNRAQIYSMQSYVIKLFSVLQKIRDLLLVFSFTNNLQKVRGLLLVFSFTNNLQKVRGLLLVFPPPITYRRSEVYSLYFLHQ